MMKRGSKARAKSLLTASLIKYIEAQRTLSRASSLDDQWVLTAFGKLPHELYQHMRKSGYVWDAKLKVWRLRVGLVGPRRYGHYE